MNAEKLKQLVEAVKDQDSILALLREGLGWELHPEFTLEDAPEIAQGVKDKKCKVFDLVGQFVDRKCFLVEFDGQYVRRDLRELLTSLRKLIRETAKYKGIEGFGDTIFIVATPGYDDVRFVLFEHQQKRLPKIRSFGWRKKFAGRTVLTHNLNHLGWANQVAWEAAWNVEALTENFYNDLVEVLEEIEQKATHPTGLAKTYVQQLLNRLLFIAFIERFEWLKTPKGSPDYLHDLWNEHKSLPDPAATYKKHAGQPNQISSFKDLLELIFFSGLDSPNGVGGQDALHALIGEVPYLNGGLFSRDPALDVAGVTIDDSAFGLLYNDKTGLFRRYNFTVTESTPLDQEVAVDPEMLGKIFERLIIAEERHKTGTYYTPRPIVEFMVNEALKGYLTDRGLPANKAELLVDKDTVESDELSFKPSEMQDAMDWLFEVRAVDPACGSGAYLLMLLQRLFELVDRLEVSRDKRRNPEQKHLYDTKLRLLQRCIYGVDLNETAVRIARLRLWLSLVVENKGEKPEPLPNFDFLIMEGDALASPVKPEQRSLYFDDLVRRYASLKRRYFHPKPGETRPSREEMKAAREEIAKEVEASLNSPLHKASKKPFDWEIEFAEVFHPEDDTTTLGGKLAVTDELPSAAARGAGFDIVVSNPPYVNSGELLKSVGEDYKKALVKAFDRTGTGTADLLVFFLDRALQLLRPKGVFAYITSNKWLKAAYGTKLRKVLATEVTVTDLVDFHDGKVFQNVICYPLITIARKCPPPSTHGTVYTDLPRPERDEVNPDLRLYREQFGHTLPAGALGTNGEWRLETGEGADRLAKMRARGIPLGDYVKGRIYYGIKTGLNEVKIGSDGKMYGKKVPPGVKVVRKEGVFVIDGAKRAELIAEDPKSEEIIRPLIAGRDIRRWSATDSDRWLIYVPWHFPLHEDVTIQGPSRMAETAFSQQYPAVYGHLKSFEPMLRARNRAETEVRYEWYALQRWASDYRHEFDKPKIVYMKISVGNVFAFDNRNSLINDACFMIVGRDHYLLGVMNSVAGWQEIERVCPQVQNGRQLMFEQLRNMLVPTVTPTERTEIEQRVTRLIYLRECESANRQIAQLQTLTSDDIDISSIRAVHGEKNIPEQIEKLEREIDARVNYLYFHQQDGVTFDEWTARLAAEKGTIVETIRGLIAGGEGQDVEFKESVVWDMRQDKHNTAMRDEVLKEICAMLNADGGTILCGVHDNGSITGLAKDLKHHKNKDGLGLVITSAMGDLLRPHPAELVKLNFVEIDGQTVLMITVSPDPRNRYESPNLKQPGKPATHVRIHASAKVLEGQDLINWWERRRQP